MARNTEPNADRDSFETDDTGSYRSERTLQSGAERHVASSAVGQDIGADEAQAALLARAAQSTNSFGELILSQAVTHQANLNAQTLAHQANMNQLTFARAQQSLDHSAQLSEAASSNLKMANSQRSTIDGKTAENIQGLNETDAFAVQLQAAVGDAVAKVLDAYKPGAA